MARAPLVPGSRHVRRAGGAGHYPTRPLLGALVALAAACALLAGCNFQPGSDQIAFQRGDQLWVANPDGSSARQLAPDEVAGYAWSPDHRELVFRFGLGASPPPAGATWAAPESPSDLAVVSISGGQATQITPNNGGLARSDGWWDPQGNRLLYREYGNGAALAAIYFDSQNDQPIGIARKVLLDAAALPTLAPDGQRVAVIDPSGNIRIGAPSQAGKVVVSGAVLSLPGSGRPARLLWRPSHDALLYFTAGDQPNSTTLRLLDLSSGKSSAITTISGLLDADFSPDGGSLLLQTTGGLLIWPVGGAAPRATIPESDTLAQAWWSPDSRWLLTADSQSLRLYSGASDWNAKATLNLITPLIQPGIGPTTPWRPTTANPWRADSSGFVFASAPAGWLANGLTSLRASPAGVYVERLSGGAPEASPTLIASGNVSAPSWGYSDPSTVLLEPAA